MDPTVWGRGAWAIIFILIYKSIQKINSVDDREEYTYELENLKKNYILYVRLYHVIRVQKMH